MKTAGMYVLMVLIIGIASKNLYDFIMLHRDPMSYQEAWTDTPAVKIGGVLKAHFALTRIRTCRTEVQSFIENDETQEIVMRQSYIGGARAIGVYKDVLTTFRLPPPSEPGNYSLRTLAVNECVEGVHTVPAPAIRFRVEN